MQFDLAVLESDPLVTGSQVDLDGVNFVRIVDIVGNGERLVAFSKKAKEFFARNDVKDNCRKVVELSQRISRLERELAALRGGP